MKTVDFHTHPAIRIFRTACSALGIDPKKEDAFPLPCVVGAFEEARFAVETLDAVGVMLATKQRHIPG